ncbi:hypothetical protein [Mesorhizobium sp. f-mel]
MAVAAQLKAGSARTVPAHRAEPHILAHHPQKAEAANDGEADKRQKIWRQKIWRLKIWIFLENAPRITGPSICE